MTPYTKQSSVRENYPPPLLSGMYFFSFSHMPFHSLLQFHFKIQNLIWWTSKSFLLYNEFEANGSFDFLNFTLVNPISGLQMRDCKTIHPIY